MSRLSGRAFEGMDTLTLERELGEVLEHVATLSVPSGRWLRRCWRPPRVP